MRHTTVPARLVALLIVSACGSPDDTDSLPRDSAEAPAVAPQTSDRSTVLVDATEWAAVGDSVDTRGLDVRFRALGEEVEIWTGSPPSTSVGLTHTVVLADTAATYSVTNGGVTFAVRLRATGTAVGAELELSIRQAGTPGLFGGELEAEDVQLLGQWLTVEWARLLNTPSP